MARTPAKKKAKAKKSSGGKSPSRKYVVVTSKSYGNALRGTRVYYEGKRPKGLKDDGSISFGKHILETLRRTFAKQKPQWIITLDEDSITRKGEYVYVRTSKQLLDRMTKESWERRRDIMTDIVRRFFAIAFPNHFEDTVVPVYVPGSLHRMLDIKIVQRLSAEDKEGLKAFLPHFLAAESMSAVGQLSAAAQIKTLKELATDLAREISRTHPESWWQEYIRAKILLIQQGYIKAIEKMNVAVGDTRFPDFCLVTHDSYLDVLEIKRPDTGMLKLDKSRDNYYWDAEMAKAIAQVENYINHITSKADTVRSYLKDKEAIDVKAVRPRGIILAGNAGAFQSPKERDDFRLLAQGIKNLTVVTYDELLERLKNFINVLDDFGDMRKAKGR